MSARDQVPPGEEILMEGAFDPAVWRREALASAGAFGFFVAIVVILVRPGPAGILLLALLGLGLALWAGREYRAGRGRGWALTPRRLYLTDRPPVELAEMSRVRGTFSNVRIRVHGQPTLVLLGCAEAVALRERIWTLRAGGRG